MEPAALAHCTNNGGFNVKRPSIIRVTDNGHFGTLKTNGTRWRSHDDEKYTGTKPNDGLKIKVII